MNEYPEYYPILALWSYLEWYQKRDVPFRANLASYKKRSAHKAMPFTFIALNRTIPVGMISLKENDLWSRGDLNPWLASLYVLPEFRNSGIGNMLINAVIGKAREQNYVRIYLFLGGDNRSNLESYYSKRGWLFFDTDRDNDGLDTKIFYYNLN